MDVTAASYAAPTPRFNTAKQPNGVSGADSQQNGGARTSVAKVIFNPRSRFDAEAGVFVMEVRSRETGEIERLLPDERQLQAYREAHQRSASNTQQGSAGGLQPSRSTGVSVTV